ncbi:MAG: hypothetical protein HY718_02420 [Planctomycetes bacterium]|nr:hypothetical protein [Planctomycetota bacterium]
MPTRKPIRAAGFAVLIVWLAALNQTASAVVAQTSTDAAPVLYALTEGSTYQHGCFPPCRCPISELARVQGTFVLTPTGFDGLFTTYKVAGVHWVVPRSDSFLRIYGSGSYRVGGEFAVMQQLILDLVIDGQPVQHFDSGLVVGGGGFPAIDVVISINGMVCLDTVIHVVAKPLPVPSTLYRLARGSTFQQGCFDFCACPVTLEMPLRGTFILSPAEKDPLFAHYKVTQVNWRVVSEGWPVHLTGSGTYRVGGEVAITHQLQLDLSINGGPVQRFDSGLVPGGGYFPAIDITISTDPAACFRTIIQVRARPAGDFNLSGSVDQEDFDHYQACLTGPAITQDAAACRDADLDGDDDIDQEDFAILQRCITEERLPIDPQCAE